MDPEKKPKYCKNKSKHVDSFKKTFKKKIKEGPYYISWHLLMM